MMAFFSCLPITNLAVAAEKSEPFGGTEVLPAERKVASRACLLFVNEPVFPELKNFLPFVKIETIASGFVDYLRQLSRWDMGDPG
jgi:hypothetical protein